MEHSDTRIRYALGILLGEQRFTSQGCDWFYYGVVTPQQPGALCMLASGFFDVGRYGTPESLPQQPLAEVEGVPLLFGRPVVERRGKTLVVHADLIASTYFLVTRYEEWVQRSVRDEHGRFPGRASLPFRSGFISRPIVDEYTRLLRKWAAEICVDLPETTRRFSVLLTHDVDSIGARRGPLQIARCIAGGCLGRRLGSQAVRDACVAAGLRRHPHDNLEQVIRMDQNLTRLFPAARCRSLYFFMAGGNSPYDGAYPLCSRRVIKLLQHIVSSGAEIGLHASYEAGSNPTHVAAEREALEAASGLRIEKNRHHFLRWREPEHGVAIANAGIRWDATLGYADVAGFRLGVCHPIPLFDPVRQTFLEIEEHPLIVMDCTLDWGHYMNLDEEAAFNYVKRLADATFQFQGEFVMLWHNTVLAFGEASYHRRLYLRVLDYLASLLGGTDTSLRKERELMATVERGAGTGGPHCLK